MDYDYTCRVTSTLHGRCTLHTEHPGDHVWADADPIDHPSHYTFGTFEVIDVIEDWRLGFHEGNAVKYIARAKHKGHEREDLEKARWYLDRIIQRLIETERMK